MGFGAFGKLPQKRDFIAQTLPRMLLEPFESWLQSAVAASRSELGSGWEEAYLVAPVWRFWIGAEILGSTCAGAMIPSVDGVGRFFPLAILYAAEPGETLPPPLFDPLDAWYDTVEARLLSVLDDTLAVDVAAIAAGLEPPRGLAEAPLPAPSPFKRGQVWQTHIGTAGALLGTLLAAESWNAASAKSFWWTNGGAATGPLVYRRSGLPDPFFYVNMIRGKVG